MDPSIVGFTRSSVDTSVRSCDHKVCNSMHMARNEIESRKLRTATLDFIAGELMSKMSSLRHGHEWYKEHTEIWNTKFASRVFVFPFYAISGAHLVISSITAQQSHYLPANHHAIHQLTTMLSTS